MLRAILNKSWKQHPTKQQLYGLLPPITKTIQVRWTRHAGHCYRSREELISDVLLWTPSHGQAKSGETSSNLHTAAFLRIPCVALRTCRKPWTIRRCVERGSRISVLMALQDEMMRSASLLTEQRHKRASLHACAIKSSMIICKVKSRPQKYLSLFLRDYL